MPTTIESENNLRAVLKSRITDPRSGGFYQTWTVAFVLVLYGIEWVLMPASGIAPSPVFALVTYLVAVITDRVSEMSISDDHRLY